GASGQHEGREDRPELTSERNAEARAGEAIGLHEAQRGHALQRDDGAGEESGQSDDRHRLHADELALLDEKPPAIRRRDAPGDGLEQKARVLTDAVYEREGDADDRVRESDEGVFRWCFGFRAHPKYTRGTRFEIPQ